MEIVWRENRVHVASPSIDRLPSGISESAMADNALRASAKLFGSTPPFQPNPDTMKLVENAVARETTMSRATSPSHPSTAISIYTPAVASGEVESTSMSEVTHDIWLAAGKEEDGTADVQGIEEFVMISLPSPSSTMPDTIRDDEELVLLHEALFWADGPLGPGDIEAYYKLEMPFIEHGRYSYIEKVRSFLKLFHDTELPDEFRQMAAQFVGDEIHNHRYGLDVHHWGRILRHAVRLRQLFPRLEGPGLMDLAVGDVLEDEDGNSISLRPWASSKWATSLSGVGFDRVVVLGSNLVSLHRANRRALLAVFRINPGQLYRAIEEGERLANGLRNDLSRLPDAENEPLYIMFNTGGLNEGDAKHVQDALVRSAGTRAVHLRAEGDSDNITDWRLWSAQVWDIVEGRRRSRPDALMRDDVTGIHYSPTAHLDRSSIFYVLAYYNPGGFIHLDEREIESKASTRNLSSSDRIAVKAQLLLHELMEKVETERMARDFFRTYAPRWEALWQTVLKHGINPFDILELLTEMNLEYNDNTSHPIAVEFEDLLLPLTVRHVYEDILPDGYKAHCDRLRQILQELAAVQSLQVDRWGTRNPDFRIQALENLLSPEFADQTTLHGDVPWLLRYIAADSLEDRTIRDRARALSFQF